MRVHYVTMLFPYPGETFAGSDVRALLREGVEVEVHSLRPRHPENDELIAKWDLGGVSLSHGGAADVIEGLGVAVRRPALLWEALKLAASTIRRPEMFLKTVALLPRALSIFDRVERERPQILHLFWGHYPSLVARLVQQRLPDVATSVFLGAYDLDWSYPLSRSAALGADIVWTHARANVPSLLKLGLDETRIRVAYRGLDLTRIPPLGNKVDGRIVSAGRFIPSKGMESVLRVFREVAAVRPQASLILLGDGPERARLEELAKRLGISSRVEFLGRVDHERVLSELKAAQIMLFLSQKPSERLPNAVKEAMACGCYCVAYGTPGMDELIPGESYGAVTCSSQPDEVAELVLDALDRPDLRDEVGAKARAYVLDNFDNSVTMGRYLAEWRSVSGGTRSTTSSRPSTAATPGGSNA